MQSVLIGSRWVIKTSKAALLQALDGTVNG